MKLIKEIEQEERMDPHPLNITEEEMVVSLGKVWETHHKGLSNDEVPDMHIEGKIVRWGFPDFITLDLPHDTGIYLNWTSKINQNRIPIKAIGWPSNPGAGGDDRWRYQYNYLVYEGPYVEGKYKFKTDDIADRQIELHNEIQKTFHDFDKKVEAHGYAHIYNNRKNQSIRSIILATSIEWGMSGGRVVNKETNETIALIRGGWSHENRNVAISLAHPYIQMYLRKKYILKK